MEMNVRQKLYEQLALDYCCTPEEVADGKNHFSVYEAREGRRRFREASECGLKVAAVNGKLLFTGREDILGECEKRYGETIGDWFMEVERFRELEKLLAPFGFELAQAHPFYLPESMPAVTPGDFEIVKYEGEQIEVFRGDKRFWEAFTFDSLAPDVLGVAAVKEGNILGMAGASADSPFFWQIGINVCPEARGKHVASTLVKILKQDILERGITPYYGTSMSNIGSQRVAHYAGFVAAWAELYADKVKKNSVPWMR